MIDLPEHLYGFDGEPKKGKLPSQWQQAEERAIDYAQREADNWRNHEADKTRTVRTKLY